MGQSPAGDVAEKSDGHTDAVDGHDERRDTDGESSHESSSHHDAAETNAGEVGSAPRGGRGSGGRRTDTDPFENVCMNADAMKMMLETMMDHFLPHRSVM